jgi:Tol biopolymer transport system component/DNA-binding winged helix-turn-helix (wHTH) protein
MSDQTDRSGPIDLSREADFRLGALEISPSTREVVRDGQRESLEPKAMQVLIALHQAAGRVVSRDDLIARCWEGRIVGEDAINRVIWRLRRLSEMDGSAPFVIETIPKVGYRIVASAANPAAPDNAPPVQARTGLPPDIAYVDPPIRRATRRWLGAGLVLAVMTAIGGWLLWPAPRWTVESSRTFLSTPAQEGEPAFSPDSRMLAYTSGPDPLSRKIHVRNVAGGDGIRVTSDAYNDVSPSWSSDGTHLAYVAQKPGEPCRIMVATIPAGEAREAGRCAQAETSSVSWQPGTQFLYYTDRAGIRGSVIVRLDLDTGAKLQIVSLNQAETTLWDLRCSPDGKSLLYVRQQPAAPEPIVIHHLASGKEKVLGQTTGTTGANGSAAWSEDSKTVLASLPSGIGSKIIAYPVDGATPYPVYATATVASHLAIGGGLVALETDSRRTNLVRASATPITQPDVIDSANGVSSTPSFAPDGTLAFISNRSGTNAVWIMKPGSAPTLFFDFGLRRIARSRFSPDGTRLFVGVGPDATRLVTDASPADRSGGMRILTRDGASVASLEMPSIGFGSPTWTSDSKGLIVVERQSLRAYRIAIDNPSQREPIADAGWGGVAMHGDAVFASRGDKPGLWRIDKTPKLINAKYPAGFGAPLAFRGDDVLIPDYNAEGGPRILAQPMAGGPDRILAYAPNVSGGIAVNPRTGEMIYAVLFHNSNIDLLALAKR